MTLSYLFNSGRQAERARNDSRRASQQSGDVKGTAAREGDIWTCPSARFPLLVLFVGCGERSRGESVATGYGEVNRRVPPTKVLADLDLLEYRVRELCPGLLSPSIEQFNQYGGSLRLHHRIALPVSDSAERGQKASRPDFLGEDPRRGLDAMVGVHSSARLGMACANGQVRGHQRRGVPYLESIAQPMIFRRQA